jgi:hypothetical protein
MGGSRREGPNQKEGAANNWRCYLYGAVVVVVVFQRYRDTEKGEAQIQKRCMKSNQHHNFGHRSIHT